MKIIKRSEISNYVGHQCEPSSWIEVGQGRINDFADTTEDHQFIHIDPKAAAKTPFGGTIAHGFLTLSLVSKMAEDFSIFVEGAEMTINYGMDKLRFLSPVPSGSRVRAQTTIASIVEKSSKQIVVTYAVSVEIEGNDKPALVADWITLIAMA